MGNCFRSTGTVEGPPPKRHKVDGQKYVTDEVLKLRDQASTYHGKVVSFAQQASDAYKNGKKKEAHTYSENKKSWQKKQDDANAKAAQLILSAQHWQTSGELDLHGLFLDEAMNATRDFLKYWSKKTSQRKTVLIITGAGHHSDKHRAIIRPEVEKLLRKEKLSFQSVSKNGAFEVTLRPSQ
eukprot:Nitzschia sp. Nitz4//scaffold63_size106090//94600//95145//NITZ4_004414-RA/size106090-processed-gene-0.71-mRNA-1//1//CDS//3329556047//4393//frame0